MGLIMVTYLSFFLFLAGLFSLIYFKGLRRASIGLQFIIFSGIFNFLGFAYFLYPDSLWDKSFLIIALAVLYLLLFSIFSYGYGMLEKDNLDSFSSMEFFEWDRSIWWGEDTE